MSKRIKLIIDSPRFERLKIQLREAIGTKEWTGIMDRARRGEMVDFTARGERYTLYGLYRP